MIRPNLTLGMTARGWLEGRRRALWAGAALLASCFISGPGRAQSAVQVRMEGEQFVPAHLVVKAGTTVRWINTEKRTSHSIHFVAEGLAESERVFPGESWERRFDKLGHYPYVCGPHPAMKGVIVVE